MDKENYGEAFEQIKKSEGENKVTLQSFEADYPGVLSEDNLDEILRRAAEKMSAGSENEEETEKPSDSPVQTM